MGITKPFLKRIIELNRISSFNNAVAQWRAHGGKSLPWYMSFHENKKTTPLPSLRIRMQFITTNYLRHLPYLWRG